LVAAWRASGQTAAAFCWDRGVHPARFAYWRRQVRATSVLGDGAGFVEVRPVGGGAVASGGVVVVRLASGVEVQAPVGCDARWLGAVVEALR
jgi:hypothetical protein